MRNLTKDEIQMVAGGGGECSSGGGNNYSGIKDTTSVGQEMINLYEGLVAATSHIIERVAKAF